MSDWIRRWSGAAVLTLAVLLVANALSYLIAIDNNVVQSDWWRFVHLIEVHDRGELNLHALLGPTNHPSILVPLGFLIDQLFFSMELRIPLYLPFVFLILAAFFVTRHCHHVVSQISKSLRHILLVFPLAMLVVPCMYARMFVKGPVAFNVLRTSCALLAFLFFHRVATRSRASLGDAILAIVIIPSVVLFVGQGSGVVFALALLVTLGLIAYENRSTSHLAFCAVAAASAIGSIAVFAGFLMSSPGKPLWGKVVFVLGHGTDACAYVLYALSTSVMGPFLQETVPLRLTIGAAVGVGYASTLWGCLRHRVQRHTYLPLALMSYSLIFILVVTVMRLPGSTPSAGVVFRYYADTNIGVLGMFLALTAMCALSSKIPRREARGKRTWRAAALGGVFAGMVTVQGLAFQQQWAKADRLNRRFDQMREAVINAETLTEQELIKKLRIKQEIFERYVPEAIETMRRRRLNVFAGVDSE